MMSLSRRAGILSGPDALLTSKCKFLITDLKTKLVIL